ncbi:ethylbenzene dehydrogenase-related protein [Desulfococcaceae bacterium HSG7]|nr:ethylbenzene dehydrogenase-related protein [Desulfococcaceae bacterium HSG7]
MKKIFILMSAVIFILSCVLGMNENRNTEKIPTSVKKIIQEKCVNCHTSIPDEHVDEFPKSQTQCGSCHIPQISEDCKEKGCTECHLSPSETHFYLRGYNKKDTPEQQAVTQSKFAPNIIPEGKKCIKCHIEDAEDGTGAGFPSLETDAKIVAAAEKGTLRSWIQPGGFMAKYLKQDEARIITDWTDNLSRNRKMTYDPYLIAVKTKSDFEIDGRGENPIWFTVPEHIIDLEPTVFTATDKIKLKAVYTDKNLYIRAEWKDSTLSMSRGGWELENGSWKHPYYDPEDSDNTKQSEDRLSIIWNMSVKNYRTVNGCAVKCHGNVPGSSEFTDHEGEKADIWHSKAARGLGVLSAKTVTAGRVNPITHEALTGEYHFKGFLDDKVLVWYKAYELGYDLEDSGRRGDKGGSAYSHNRNKSKKAPEFMEFAPVDFADAMVLTQAEIDGGEAIVADPNAKNFNKLKMSEAWNVYRDLNALVPERILRIPSGSRGDVKHYATWKNGVVINEFCRALDTGNSNDDVIFDPSKAKEYEFSVAVFDNCGRGEIPPGHNTYGDGQYQILKFK